MEPERTMKGNDGMENKEEIVMRLKLLLKATREGRGIEELALSGDQNEVTVKFRSGSERKVNVECDSGIALIRDVMKIFD